MRSNKEESNKFLQILLALLRCSGIGFKSCWKRRDQYYLYVISLALICLVLTYQHRFTWPAYLGMSPWPVFAACFMLVSLFVGSILLGLSDFRSIQKFQMKLDRIGISGSDGAYYKVVAVNKSDTFKTTVIIKSVGIGLEKYQQRKSDMESSFAEEVDSITTGRNPQIVILSLTKRKLPVLVEYKGLSQHQTIPHSFIVGESMKGVVTRTLESLPHMLIAGTTGGGKSVFFKQTLLNLLKTTPHLQLYLLDLKRGVEMKDFGELANVRIAKTEEDACKILKLVRDEMDRRFEYLEKNGHKEIIPQRDGMDKIVVGIDEASVLYSKVKSNATKSHLINMAREYTDELAKLARAAGIHLILATQKVSKETIDTKVQENIGGRVCFRMNTMVNSVTVLGNKMAFELPDVKGRAIWASGNNFIELQCPFLSDDELKAEIEILQEKFESHYPCKRKMLEIGMDDTQIYQETIPKGN